jgi:hypothetical protein
MVVTRHAERKVSPEQFCRVQFRWRRVGKFTYGTKRPHPRVRHIAQTFCTFQFLGYQTKKLSPGRGTTGRYRKTVIREISDELTPVPTRCDVGETAPRLRISQHRVPRGVHHNFHVCIVQNLHTLRATPHGRSASSEPASRTRYQYCVCATAGRCSLADATQRTCAAERGGESRHLSKVESACPTVEQ